MANRPCPLVGFGRAGCGNEVAAPLNLGTSFAAGATSTRLTRKWSRRRKRRAAAHFQAVRRTVNVS